LVNRVIGSSIQHMLRVVTSQLWAAGLPAAFVAPSGRAVYADAGQLSQRRGRLSS
jgi:hypothetical protein